MRTATDDPSGALPALQPAHRSADCEPALPRWTCGELLRRGAELSPERVALVDACGAAQPAERRRWRYAELLAATERLATALLERLSPGQRIAIWAPSSAEWLLVDLAAALAGLVVVPVNPAYRPAEARHVLELAQPALVLHGAEHRGVDLTELARVVVADLPGVVPCAELVAWAGEVLGAVPAGPHVAGSPHGRLPRVDPGDPVQIQFTSGTTGPPKGVVLHHLGLAGMPALAVQLMHLGEAPVWLNVMPLHHIGGCGLSTLGPLAALGTQVLADRFTAAGALALIEQESVTVMGSVPTMLLEMLGHPERPVRDLSSLRVVISGGAAVSAALVNEIERELGVRFVVAFGQTECHGHIAQTRPDDSSVDKAETCGRPLPHVEVKLVDPHTGATVPVGATGEVCTRSPLLMNGYLDDPAATAQAIDGEGFLHTGDLCTMDDRGFLRFVGRLKDMIVRGGENISPREIEDRLREHPGVIDAAVIGVPDDRFGESVAAVVRVGERLDVEELSAWVAAGLAPFKVPARWRFVDELPLTANGKVHKPTLRATWAANAWELARQR